MTNPNVAIFIFNDVEVLDFAGPFEVFSVTSELHNHECFNAHALSRVAGEGGYGDEESKG